MRRIRHDDRGEGMIEYGILLGTLALGVVLTLLAIGAQIRPAPPDGAPQHMGDG